MLRNDGLLLTDRTSESMNFSVSKFVIDTSFSSAICAELVFFLSLHTFADHDM